MANAPNQTEEEKNNVPRPAEPKPAPKSKPKKVSDLSAFSRFYMRIGSIFPKKAVLSYGRKLKFVGLRDDPRIWLGQKLIMSILIGLIAMLIYLTVFSPVWIDNTSRLIAFIIFIVATLVFGTVIYLRLFFRIADRASQVEKILPDFLLLIVSNLRAGMSPFTAFITAARPEFGSLYSEVKIATAKAGGKTALPDTLREIAQYFDSEVFTRTVDLFATGVRSGGQLVKLLNSNAEEVRHIHDLRAELQTATRTYTIFLGFITVMVMPFLLAVSNQFVTIFLKFQNENSGFDASTAANLPSFSGKILLTPGDMLMISVITLLLTSLMVSALSGIISRGKALYGVKYFPIISGASIAFFFVAQLILASLLANFAN